jgi:hypothetical protein
MEVKSNKPRVASRKTSLGIKMTSLGTRMGMMRLSLAAYDPAASLYS